ncbi:response regulator transcription factor [Actinoallomurus sp. CA-142502]|uniref:response regulator transcription factor n=1 Tax=Actinoallomurus sp. CA-142502 TaxID=3239885 RepID=UPI003D90C55F
MARLLIVEDDETIGNMLESRLRMHDHEVVWQRTGRGAVREATVTDFDLVLLDLGLPDLDGIEVCGQIRHVQPECVLVMLTARQEEMDIIVGLEAGADDYLTKPFSLAEVLARIRAHLRRGAPSGPARQELRIGDLMVDAGARRCFIGDREVALRAKEFDLLRRLAADAGKAVSREDLMADVWDENWFGSTKTLDVHIAAVRAKLTEAAGGESETMPRIVTLRGHGYRLDGPRR